MTEWHKTKKFTDLKNKWYGKLEKSGFRDAEKDEVNIKQYSGKTRIREAWEKEGITLEHPDLTPIADTYKYNYYQNCREFLGKYTFKNKTERTIFEMHTEGLGLRVIAVKLKTYKRKVHEILQRLVREMKRG